MAITDTDSKLSRTTLIEHILLHDRLLYSDANQFKTVSTLKCS